MIRWLEQRTYLEVEEGWDRGPMKGMTLCEEKMDEKRLEICYICPSITLNHRFCIPSGFSESSAFPFALNPRITSSFVGRLPYVPELFEGMSKGV